LKFVKSCLILCLFPSALYGAVTHVQSDGVTAGGSVASVSKVVTGIVAGNTIAVCGVCDQGQCPTNNKFSDDKANAYVYAIESDGRATISYVVNAAAGDTDITLTPASSDFIGFGVAEFAGVHNSSPADGANSATAVSTTPVAGSIVTTTAGVIIGCLDSHSDGTITPDGGWNEIWENEAYTVIAGSMVYQIGAAASYNASWVKGNSADWAAADAALKEGAAPYILNRRAMQLSD
jgi:hypothetical protein